MRIIRKGAKVKEIKITEDQLAAVKAIEGSNKWRLSHDRRAKIRAIIGYNVCCICEALPVVQLQFREEGIKVVENYCRDCREQVYTRAKEKDRPAVAAKYGCVVSTTTP